MLQCRVILYALQLIGDNLFLFRLDAVVVLLYHLFHAVIAVLVPEIGNDRNRLVRLSLLLTCLHPYLFRFFRISAL